MLRSISLLFPFCSAFLCTAQLVNPGFEEWSNTSGVNEPVGWTTFNSLGDIFGVTFAEQGQPGAVGNSFLRMTANDLDEGSPLSSIVVFGNADEGHDGFPWTTRPGTFRGQHRFYPQGDDEAQIIVAFYRWDVATQAREGLGGGYLSTDVNTPNWTAFNVPITFYAEGIPDTVSISFISGGGETPQAGTIFDVDDIGFDGEFTGIAEQEMASVLRVSPSPTVDRLWWSRDGVSDASTWQVCDLQGRTVAQGNAVGAHGSVDVSTLAQGGYVLRLVTSSGVPTAARFVKD